MGRVLCWSLGCSWGLWRDVAKRVPVGDLLTRLSWNWDTGIRIHVEYDSVKELLDKVNVDTHDSQSSYEGRVSEPTNETPSLVTQSHTPVLGKGVTALNRVTHTPISVSPFLRSPRGSRLNVFCCGSAAGEEQQSGPPLSVNDVKAGDREVTGSVFVLPR